MARKPKMESPVPPSSPSLVPLDGTPMAVASALKTAGWEQVDSRLWAKNGGTPSPWQEVIIVVGMMASDQAPAPSKAKSGLRSTEFWTMSPIIITSLIGAVATMTDNLQLIPEAQRPFVSLVLMGLAAGLSSVYMAVRAVSKAKAQGASHGSTDS